MSKELEIAVRMLDDGYTPIELRMYFRRDDIDVIIAQAQNLRELRFRLTLTQED